MLHASTRSIWWRHKPRQLNALPVMPMLYRPCGRLKKKKEKIKSILKTNKDFSKLEENIYSGIYERFPSANQVRA